MALKTTIEQLAQELANGILAAIRSTPLDELLAGAGGSASSGGGARRAASPSPGKRGGASRSSRASEAPAVAETRSVAKKGKRLPRRSANDIEQVVASIVGTLKGAKDGMRSEQLQSALKLDKREITRPLAFALAAKKIRKTGEKRATTYYAR
jgi:hypothetical protein